MDENDLEILLANNLSIEISTEESYYETVSGNVVHKNYITVEILYKGKVISSTSTTI